MKPNQVLICGPVNSGKTTLFYHMLTKEVRSTVTSIEVNETISAMPVVIPTSAVQQEEAAQIKVNLVDVPGHYNFKDRLNQSLDEAKAIILTVDSKDK